MEKRNELLEFIKTLPLTLDQYCGLLEKIDAAITESMKLPDIN